MLITCPFYVKDLSENDLDSHGAALLAGMLIENDCLHTLNLSGIGKFILAFWIASGGASVVPLFFVFIYDPCWCNRIHRSRFHLCSRG